MRYLPIGRELMMMTKLILFMLSIFYQIQWHIQCAVSVLRHAMMRPGFLQEVQGFFAQLARDPPMIRLMMERTGRVYQDEVQMKKRCLMEASAPVRTSRAAFINDFSAKVCCTQFN